MAINNQINRHRFLLALVPSRCVKKHLVNSTVKNKSLFFGESDQSRGDFIHDPLFGASARFTARQRRKVKMH